MVPTQAVKTRHAGNSATRRHTWGSALTALAIRLRCAVRRLVTTACVSLLAVAVAGTGCLIRLHLWRTAVRNAAHQLAMQIITKLSGENRHKYSSSC